MWGTYVVIILIKEKGIIQERKVLEIISVIKIKYKMWPTKKCIYIKERSYNLKL